MRSYALRHSIGTKILGAFLTMSIIIAGVGAYGYWMLGASGKIVADTYDYPMMAINFARAASVDFMQMQNDALRARTAESSRRADLAKNIDESASTLSDDLDVADERATAADEHDAIKKIRSLIREWQSTRHVALKRGLLPDLVALDQRILEQFDLLIEFNADHGFISRREAVTHINGFEDAVIGMTGLALLLSFGIAIFLARRIVRPLSAAALVANRIAEGKFETAIPTGGKDETGALLHSMQVMQESIAEQMAREKARAQSAEVRLMDAVENSGEGVILVDESGHIAVINGEWARQFPEIASRFVPGETLANVLALIEAQCGVADDDQTTLSDQLFADATSVASGAERRLPDGRWIRIVANTTREGGTILFLSDFTEIKTREENYRIAKQQAEAASAAKSRFLANMGHELRTPLNAVIGFSEILSGQMFGALGDKRYVEYSEDILNSGRHLLGVINNVLDLARSESGRVEIRKRPVDLASVLGECENEIREQCEKASITFTSSASALSVIIDADESKLKQTFQNLLSNAVKFTDPGGTITFVASEDADAVRIEVHDTGIGMTEIDIQTALTPFAQVDGRLERRYEGTGIGLPLAKAFVEAHGGTLTIQSELDRGTIVAVHLPRSEADAKTPQRQSATG